MLHVSELYIYPVKSLGGISLGSAHVTDRGFQYDRRWMLVDEDNEFITQRTFANLALFQVSVQQEGIHVKYKKTGDGIIVPFTTEGEALQVSVWDDVCKGVEVSKHVSEWFSILISANCKLVYMPDESKRNVDLNYAADNQINSFSDGYPFMMIGQSTLDDLNSRMQEKLPMNRFRPNIVITGGVPFEEDTLTDFNINSVQFKRAKLCSRCVVTTIDQDSGIKGIEPLKTLSTYRLVKNKIYFGQNLLHKGTGIISVGDAIKQSITLKQELKI